MKVLGKEVKFWFMTLIQHKAALIKTILAFMCKTTLCKLTQQRDNDKYSYINAFINRSHTCMHFLLETSGGLRTTVRQPLPLFRKGDFVPAAGGPAARINGTAPY